MPSHLPEAAAAAAPDAKSVPKFEVPKKKRKWLRRVIAVGLAVVVLVVALKTCAGGKQQGAQGYLSAVAEERALSVSVTGSGTVKPNDSYRATTLLRGEIFSAPFEEGDLVRKDQVLFTLDPTDAENNIRSAESAVDRAQLGVEQAQLALDELLKSKADAVDDMAIQATAAGTVTKVYIDAGDTVAAGTPIADILDRDTMELVVPFHAVHADGFAPGQAADVFVTGSAQRLSGVISEVSYAREVTAGGAVVRAVTIRVANPGTLSPTSTGTAQVGEVASADTGRFDYLASKQVLALMSGKVDTLHVREGDTVRDKQVLGSFELPDLDHQIDTARLSLRSAQLSLSDAQEGLRIARDALDDYTITSPIDGTVIEKNYKAGDNVDPSSAATASSNPYLAVIYDMSRLTFDMDVSELDVSKLRVGQRVSFTSDALEGKEFTGHVDKVNINGTTVSGSTNYPVTIVIDNGDGLYPGMNVSATILVEEVGNVLCIPTDAVQRGDFVYVAGAGALADDGTLTDASKLDERAVELGRADSEYIEVLSGLAPGETVYIPNTASSAMEQMMAMGG